MFWKICNKLFGWDYIHWENTAAEGVARVHRDFTGRVYYWRYKSTKVADVIHDANQVLWLTCKPDKWMAEGRLSK